MRQLTNNFGLHCYYLGFWYSPLKLFVFYFNNIWLKLNSLNVSIERIT
jgi:hypothetical protein